MCLSDVVGKVNFHVSMLVNSGTSLSENLSLTILLSL